MYDNYLPWHKYIQNVLDIDSIQPSVKSSMVILEFVIVFMEKPLNRLPGLNTLVYLSPATASTPLA